MLQGGEVVGRGGGEIVLPEDGSVAAGFLDRIIEYLSRTRDTSVSLRALAEELGTSHRMLQYYFGSRQQLLWTVLQALRTRDRLVVPIPTSRADFLKSSWAVYRTPTQQLQLDLFFILSDPSSAEASHGDLPQDKLIGEWTTPFIAMGMREGLSEDRARAEARLVVAALRGLHNDLVASGDEKGIDAAHAALVRWLAGAGEA